MATPGSPLLTIEKAGALRLEVSVDESLLSLVRVGANVPVTIDTLGGDPMDGKVSQIAPAADPGSRSFLVKIDLPTAPGLHSGMYGHAQLMRGSKDVLTIPRTAVIAHGSMLGVYAVGQNHIAELRYISVGNSHGNEIEVLSGLSGGETVINSPGERELSGKRIEVQQ
jgi:RND family efflux transporter MFP subunit